MFHKPEGWYEHFTNQGALRSFGFSVPKEELAILSIDVSGIVGQRVMVEMHIVIARVWFAYTVFV